MLLIPGQQQPSSTISLFAGVVIAIAIVIVIVIVTLTARHPQPWDHSAMAQVPWKSTLFPSDLWVEACGAIVFDLTSRPRKVMLVYDRKSDEWLLAKGRRNLNESRQAAALREVEEETGYACRLRPMAMTTRAPSDAEPADVRDAPRTYGDVTEAFMLDVRDQGQVKGVAASSPLYTADRPAPTSAKLVWWFLAEVEGWVGPGEARYKPHFFDWDTATTRLTYQRDRDILRHAIDLLQRQGVLRAQAERAQKRVDACVAPPKA